MEMEWEGIDLIIVNSVATFHHVLVVCVFCVYDAEYPGGRR